MGVDIVVKTPRERFAAGDVVEGSVALDVGEGGTAAAELILQLRGQATTRVMYTSTNPGVLPDPSGGGVNAVTYTNREIVTEKQEFLTYDLVLHTFDGRAETGAHSFPFAIILPLSLPSSMKEEGHSGDSCAISYYVQARLHRPGLLHFDAKGKTKIIISARPANVPPKSAIAGPDTQIVKRCCCFRSGSMSLALWAERTALSRDEKLGLTIVATNQSAASVEEMTIEVSQEATWYAHGVRSTRKRPVGTRRITASDLGGLRDPMEKGADRGRSATAMADAATAHLQEVLDSGGGFKHEIKVPDRCSDTMSIGIIDVKHALAVRLKTPKCITSPEVWLPITLVGKMADSIQDSVAQGDGGDASDQGATEGPESHEKVTPVQVPQEALARSYDYQG